MKKIIYFITLIILLAACKKSPNSTSQGNTNPPPQTGHHYLTDTTINFPTGLVPSTLAELQSVPVLDTSVLPVCETRTSISTIDPAYDLSKNIPGMPKPGDQGRIIGNCTAWTVGYGMMSYLYAVKGGYSDYNSTDRIFSPEFIYNQRNGGVNNGISLYSALQFVKHVGCCTWTDMPVDNSFTEQPSLTALDNATNHKITNFYRISQIDIIFLKSIIDIWKYPLAFSCTVDRGFMYADSPSWDLRQGNRYVWKGLNGDTPHTHSMLIVGYDDAINAFKVLNSWGKGWGALKLNDPNNDGYCWIDYNIFKKVVITNLDNSGNYLPEIFIGTLVGPTLVTTLPTSTTSTTAVSGGNITYDGNNLILSRGVCWSTKTNPTTSDNEILSGSGTGAFSSTLSGLTEGQTYHLKAFAVTGAGTTYGNEVSFATSGTGTGSTVTDIDGNVYNTVTIGTQVWMKENLKTSHYRNGEVIPQVTDAMEWKNSGTSAWCYYDNDPNNDAIYGKLYNWGAVTDTRGLAPVGWHIPTTAEWNVLSTFLGGELVAGAKMKAISTLWYTNSGATNSSGFTALPAGYRYMDGNYYSIGTYTYFWSSTVSDLYFFAWIRYLWSFDDQIHTDDYNSAFGFSVRCVKD